MYNGAGSLFALGMRVTKLDDTGSPLVGPRNSYTTDALIQAQLGLEYEDGDEIIQKNGAGLICLTYKANDSLKRGTISGLQVCTPDPNILQFMVGGRVLERGAAQVGYQAPEVGSDPNPNGFSLELWTRAVIDGAFAGYFWWVVPRAQLRPSGDWTLSGADPLVPEFEGTCTQNPNWLDGPNNDWEFNSERVWQFVQTATIPNLTPDFHPVTANVVVASIDLTPTTNPLAVGATAQLVTTATLTPPGSKIVTNAATYTSSDVTKATVNSGGLVTAVAVGTATITATYGGFTDTATVTVT